jgi:phenylalanyl-tRNA synthetase alpha chain
MSRLRGEDLPYKMFTIGRNFRPDVIDPKHFIEFYQCEGIVIGEGLTLRHLLAYLREIATALGIERIRFKPGYFPMTEPSVEGLTWIRRLGWVETLPGGIFRPELTLPLGIDLPVLAWGVGIDRLALVKLEINDIRMLLSDDLAWLRGRALVRL